MRNLEATVSEFLSKLARNNYSEQSAPSLQSAATAEAGAGEKMSEENNNNHALEVIFSYIYRER